MTSAAPATGWVDGYLARIGAPRPASADLQALRDLQVAHLLAVPFENLSIHLGEPVVLDQAALVAKVVWKRRGGFCYELTSDSGDLPYNAAAELPPLIYRSLTPLADPGWPYPGWRLAGDNRCGRARE